MPESVARAVIESASSTSPGYYDASLCPMVVSDTDEDDLDVLLMPRFAQRIEEARADVAAGNTRNWREIVSDSSDV